MTIVVAAVALVLAAADAPPAADRAEAAAHTVLDHRYQRDLPIHVGKAEEAAPKKSTNHRKPSDAPERDRDPRLRPADEDEGAGGGFGAVIRAILFALIGVAVAMVIVWLVSDLRKGKADETLEGAPAPEPAIDEDVIVRPLGDADELARAGRFAEAIHTLLLRTLGELVRSTRTRVPAALTSREILARVPLVPDARTALHGLVGAVEISWFGDEVPAAADYDRCRREFERFADAYRRAA